MKQNTLIWGIIALLVVAAGFWYFMYLPAQSGTPTTDQVATTTDTTGTTGTTVSTAPKTFKSIFTQTGNYECLYEQNDESGRSSSSIHISDGKMRGEFRSTTGDKTTASLMIYNGGYLYSWKEGATVGKKSSIKTLADLPEVIPTDLTSGAIFGVTNDSVSWDCHFWNTDPSIFVIPSYVTFSL